MAAKGRGSFPFGFSRPIFRDEVPVSFWEGIPACTKQELLNPVNGSIATNLTLFFCEIAFFICISTWWTIKNPLQQAFSWLYPSFWSHKRQVAGHRYKRGLTQISWCLTKFRWNMVKYSLMTVKSSSTEAIYLLCIYPQVVPTDLFRLMEEILQQKKVEIKTKNQPFPEKKLGRLSPPEILNCLKKTIGSPNSLSPQSFPQLIPSLFETWRSLAFLLTTSLIWHAAAPSIKVTPDSEVVFLKGTDFFLQKDGGKGCWSFDGVPTDARKSLCNWGYNLHPL